MISWNDFEPPTCNYYRTRKEKYCDDILTFDIECSSGWLKDGIVIPYEKGKSEKYWNELTPVSLCYIWQFGYNDTVIYGRTLEEFLEVLNMLKKDVTYYIYIHNLSYEFMFLSNILTWKEVFAREPHKPIYCISNEFPNIVFRCSYMLNRVSLRTWGESIGEYKEESINYELLRTPKTELTSEELKYCEQDILVMYHGLIRYRHKYNHIHNIPLTQTGEVRKVVKGLLLSSDSNYARNIIRQSPNTYEELIEAQRIFQGGYTHANMVLSDRIFRKETDGIIHSFDFASSYPYVLCSEKFPITHFIKKPYNKKYLKDYCYILEVKFINLRATNTNHYIMAHKCYNESNMVLDNGRVISGSFTTMITDVDMNIIERVYEWDSIEIKSSKASRKGYLPKVFIEYILELYCDKTSLKGVDGKEELYMQQKQYINSLFGMAVSSPCNDEVLYNGVEWSKLARTSEYVNDFFNKLKNRNYGKIFMNYYTGVFCTAYARKNLWDCMLKCGVNGEDVIYCDTDSIKCRGEHNFDWYNKQVDEKLQKMCKHYNIDFEKTRPKTIKGVAKPLGYFEEENPMKEFITLGAKKYCYRTMDNKLHITVSGINKQAVDCLDNNIENFKKDFVFDKDNDNVTKKLCHYITNQPKVTWNVGKYDEFESDYNYGINLRRTGYKIGITNEYEKLIELCKVVTALNGTDDRIKRKR